MHAPGDATLIGLHAGGKQWRSVKPSDKLPQLWAQEQRPDVALDKYFGDVAPKSICARGCSSQITIVSFQSATLHRRGRRPQPGPVPRHCLAMTRVVFFLHVCIPVLLQLEQSAAARCVGIATNAFLEIASRRDKPGPKSHSQSACLCVVPPGGGLFATLYLQICVFSWQMRLYRFILCL